VGYYVEATCWLVIGRNLPPRGAQSPRAHPPTALQRAALGRLLSASLGADAPLLWERDADLLAAVCHVDAQWRESEGGAACRELGATALYVRYAAHLDATLTRLLGPRNSPHEPSSWRSGVPDTAAELPRWRDLCARWCGLLRTPEPLRSLSRAELRRQFERCDADGQTRLRYLTRHVDANPFDVSVIGGVHVAGLREGERNESLGVVERPAEGCALPPPQQQQQVRRCAMCGDALVLRAPPGQAAPGTLCHTCSAAAAGGWSQ